MDDHDEVVTVIMLRRESSAARRREGYVDCVSDSSLHCHPGTGTVINNPSAQDFKPWHELFQTKLSFSEVSVL